MASETPALNVDASLPPNFHQLGEYRFQRFITDLYGYEPDIATSTEYGMRGQADHGADVIARRNGGDGQEVASCKCYQQTSAAQICDWSDEFLEHWDEHWSGQGIRRFVLATTAHNTASRPVQDQVTRERERFAALGVAYEMWGPVTFVSKLRPHRSVSLTYLGPMLTDHVFGPASQPGMTTSTGGGLVSAALIGQVQELQARLSAHALEAAERANEDLRAGRTETVRILIGEQRRPESWEQLDGRAQAKVLRLAASLALIDRDVAEAERLSQEADALSAQDEPRLSAHIELERSGPAAALEVLGQVTSASGLQLRIALRVMAGQVADARDDLVELLKLDPQDPESMRMDSLVALASGRPFDALPRIQQAERIAPERNAVRQLGAMVRYACALSPTITPEWYLSPNAFDGAFVREDSASQSLLAQALSLLDRIIESEPDPEIHRVWHLAVLASMRSERNRAREEAADLLVRTAHDPTVIAWCLFRGIDVDLADSEAALLARYEAGADATTVQVLGLLLTRRDDPGTGSALLQASLDCQEGAGRKEAEEWIGRLVNETGTAPPSSKEPHSTFAKARIDGNWAPVAARIAELLSPDPAPEGLALAEGLAAEGRFDLLAPHVEALLRFATATAIRLAAYTSYRVGNPSRALSILDEQASAFGEALPPDMRRLRADALARTGNVPAALREADAVAGSGSTPDRLFRAELLSSTGNVRGAVAAVREALNAGLLQGDKAFRWSRMMRAEEPALARQLLQHAITTDLDERLVAAAMHDALSLQLGSEGDALMARVHARALSGAGDIRILTIDELPALIAAQQAQAAGTEKMYLDGEIPVHLLLAHDPVAFALLHLGPNLGSDGNMRPWPIRHGSRPFALQYDLPWSSWRLHVDLSALLVATRLELLDVLEAHPHGVAIPADVPLVLLAMETGCRERGDATIAERVLAADLRPIGRERGSAVSIVASGIEPDGSDLSLVRLVDLLVERRWLDAEAAARIVDGLPASPDGQAPTPGSALRLDAESLRRLATADALALVAERFDASCEGVLLEHAERARADAAAALDAAQALARLRGRIAAGLEAGLYRLMPRTVADADEGDDLQDAMGDTQISRCLADTISAPGSDGAVAWIDDRMVTGYARTNSMPVVGIGDVLAALASEGRVTEKRQHAALASLRAAGALFLVPSVEEVTAALMAAPHRGQHLTETPALATVRRSLALTALNEHHLVINGTGVDGRADEIVPMQTAMRLLASCLQKLWLDDSFDFDQRIAMSDWLWLNVRRTHVGWFIPGEERAAAQDSFEVIQIAHCLDQAVDIGLLRDTRRQARIDYLQWLWLRAVEPLLAVDPGFLTRLTRYLVDFYAEMDRAHAGRSPKDRRILHALLATRVQRLPDPLQGEIYKDPRMRSFGSSKEIVTIAGGRFEADAFWRAVRRALRYGTAGIRPERRGKARSRRVRLRREGEGLILSGVVRVRLGDRELAVVAANDAERSAAIDRLVAGLQLPAGTAARVADEARAARSTRKMVAVLREASEASAASRYREAAAKLARRQRFRLDALAPAPADAVLASIHLEDTTVPLRSTLAATRRKRDAEDPVASLIETAGIPVLRAGQDLAASGSDVVIARARTPMALIHVAAAARAAGRPAAEIAAICERLVASVERNGELFVALLRWTHRAFLRDARWRAAPPSYALAAMWSHADRILDLAVGLEPDSLRRSIQRSDPEVAGVDLLKLQEGPPDVSSPSWISPAALLHHGLAAIFEAEDPKPLLGDPLFDRLYEAQLFRTSNVVGPETRLLLRRDDWPNAMEAFLTGSPVGFGEGALERSGTKNSLITGALSAMEANPEDPAAWLQLGAFAAGGLDPDAYRRLTALIHRDPGRMVRFVVGGTVPTLWRALLQPIAWHDVTEASRLAREIALACRRWHEAHALEPDSPISTDAVSHELVELGAHIAGASSEGDATFADVLDDMAQAWPSLRGILHQTVGNVLARTPSGRADQLWTLLSRLGAR